MLRNTEHEWRLHEYRLQALTSFCSWSLRLCSSFSFSNCSCNSFLCSSFSFSSCSCNKRLCSSFSLSSCSCSRRLCSSFSFSNCWYRLSTVSTGGCSNALLITLCPCSSLQTPQQASELPYTYTYSVNTQKKLSYHRGTERRSMLVRSRYVSWGMAVRKVLISKSDLQGHRRWCHSIGHIWFLISFPL